MDGTGSPYATKCLVIADAASSIFGHVTHATIKSITELNKMDPVKAKINIYGSQLMKLKDWPHI
jgi:hypothetical protein